jgi:hypothetical protein
MKAHNPPTPRLNAHLECGTIIEDDGTYFGHASDGTLVELGSKYDLEAIENYLGANPLPELW